MMRRSIWMTLMFFISLSLFGCLGSIPTSTPIPTPLFTPSAEQMEKSPFTGIPCAPPCWQGLEVGKSTESDVIAVLPSLTFIKHETLQTFNVSMPNFNGVYGSGKLFEASCANSGQQCLSIAVIDDVLTKIIVGLNYDINPIDAVGYLGPPDYVGYQNLGAETIVCDVYMIWMKSKLVLASSFKGSERAEKFCFPVRATKKLPADLLFTEARFLSDAELSALMSTSTGSFFKFTGTIP